MSPNHFVVASGATVAVSVVVATAIALYENPELRRYADVLRQRIAVALHSMGDGINPPHREPIFNRPEDAHGFLQSSAEPGVEADEETKRRQREELLYWNSVRLQREAENQRTDGQGSKMGSTFDDFMRPDAHAEEGTYVYNTGVDVTQEDDSGLRHRGDGAKGAATAAGVAAAAVASSSLYANPFADEYNIGGDDVEEAANQMAPVSDEAVSDIYSVTTAGQLPSLIDFDEPIQAEPQVESAVESDRPLEAVDLDPGAYASLQAWAQQSSESFHSPLPSTPTVPASEPELVSDGEATPTDSMSVVESGVDVADESDSWRAGDVMSESDGMLTPASWSEVGSVISESDAALPTEV